MATLPNEAITGRLLAIDRHERGLLVETLGHLAELDRRNAALTMGFPSLFTFCTDFLGYSKGCAHRRTKAARLLSRFPVVADYLADGRLNLTNVVELHEVLDEEHVVEILDRAVGRTEDQVKELVASLRPQPPRPDLLRKLPTPRNQRSGSGPNLELPASSPPSAAAAPAVPQTPAPVASLPPPPPPRAARPRLEPIAPELHVLRVTVSGAFVEDLKAVRDALSHKLPGGSLEEVLHECIRVTLEKIEKRRRGVGKKVAAKTPESGDGYVPAAVRAEIWDRDDGRCTFVGSTGRRCSSRYQIENHHQDPTAKLGLSTKGNVRLFCRAHNALAAEQDFGRTHVAGKIAEARRRRRPPADPTLPGLG